MTEKRCAETNLTSFKPNCSSLTCSSPPNTTVLSHILNGGYSYYIHEITLPTSDNKHETHNVCKRDSVEKTPSGSDTRPQLIRYLCNNHSANVQNLRYMQHV